jgi:type I restriction enzyme, S subunit
MSEEIKAPGHWEVKRLGEVCKCVTGTTPPKNNPNNYGYDVPFVKPPQLFDKPVNDAPEMLSKKGATLARILPINSVLVTCIGNLGRTGINTTPIAFNQQINAIIPSNNLDAKFLFYQAQAPVFRIQLEDLVAATTVPIVNKGKFETIEITLPPLPEQRAIVAKIEELLSDLENGRQQLLKAQEQLKVYRQSLLKAAFEGRLTNKKVKEGELPEGWKWVELKEICEIKRGKSKHRPRNDPSLLGGKYPFVQTGDIRNANGSYITTFTQTYNEKGLQQSKLWPKGTLCITIAANIGETAILGLDACFPDSVVGLVCSENIILNKYANYFLISHKSNLEKLAPATAQKNINVEILEKINIPLPPLFDQQHIIDVLESRLTVCDKLEQTISDSLSQSESLRQSILKKAFEGKLVKPVIAAGAAVKELS